jgi:hypothetical protein
VGPVQLASRTKVELRSGGFIAAQGAYPSHQCPQDIRRAAARARVRLARGHRGRAAVGAVTAVAPPLCQRRSALTPASNGNGMYVLPRPPMPEIRRRGYSTVAADLCVSRKYSTCTNERALGPVRFLFFYFRGIALMPGEIWPIAFCASIWRVTFPGLDSWRTILRVTFEATRWGRRKSSRHHSKHGGEPNLGGLAMGRVLAAGLIVALMSCNTESVEVFDSSDYTLLEGAEGEGAMVLVNGDLRRIDELPANSRVWLGPDIHDSVSELTVDMEASLSCNCRTHMRFCSYAVPHNGWFCPPGGTCQPIIIYYFEDVHCDNSCLACSNFPCHALGTGSHSGHPTSMPNDLPDFESFHACGFFPCVPPSIGTPCN